MNITIILLKNISLLLTAGFAAFGITHDFKDKTSGKVTKHGYVAIIGLIVGGLISMALLDYDEHTKAVERTGANTEKAALNQQFEGLVQKANENIIATNKTINNTGQIAQDLQYSVASQKKIVERTETISTRTELLAQSLDKTANKQSQILGENKKILAGVKEQIDSTKEMAKEQSHLMKNSLSSLSPLEKLAVGYRIKFDMTDPIISNYIRTLFKVSQDNFDPYKHIYSENGFEVWSQGELTQVTFYPESPRFFSELDENYKNKAGSYTHRVYDTEDKNYIAQLLDDMSNISIDFVTADTDKLNEFDDKIREVHRGMLKGKTPTVHATGWNLNHNYFFEKKIVINSIKGKLSAELSVITDVISWTNSDDSINGFSDLPNKWLAIHRDRGVKIIGFAFFTGIDFSKQYCIPVDENNNRTLQHPDGQQSKYLFYHFNESDFHSNGRCFR